jgi:hypothetical protein
LDLKTNQKVTERKEKMEESHGPTVAFFRQNLQVSLKMDYRKKRKMDYGMKLEASYGHDHGYEEAGLA